MKNLNQYIIEKFKISSKTINKSQEIYNKFRKTIFTEEEISDINEHAHDLPIIPDIITNFTDFQPKNDRTGHAYNSSIVMLGYYVDLSKNRKYHSNNYIRIKKYGNKFSLKIVKIGQEDVYFYPYTGYFNSIKECFDCIEENWEEIKFSEVIKEYQ